MPDRPDQAGLREDSQARRAAQPGQPQLTEDAHNMLATLVDSSDAAIIGKSLDNIILSWNRGAEKMYGYRAEEVIGRPLTILLPPDRPGEMDEIAARVARGERVEQLETVRLTRDGRRVDVSLVVSPNRDADGRITSALTVARDITDQLAARKELERTQARDESRAVVLEAANHVALDILANRTGIEALRHIAEAARSLAGARYAALGVARADGTGLTEFITTGLTREQEAAIGPRPRGGGVLGVLLHRTEPLRIDNLADHPDSVGFPANHPAMGSFLGVPIRRGQTVLGSLYLTDKLSGGAFTPADEAAVSALGAHAAVAIHNMQMIERQRALVRGLMTAQEEERRAVAYDLHDGLTQFVMASHAHMESFRRAHQQGNEERAARELDNGLRYLKEAVVESRRLVNGLRSLALDDLGIAGALEQHLSEEKARAGWTEANIVHNIAGRRFDRALETAAYRVAQEALTNVRKHADARNVHVMVLTGADPETHEPQLTVEVRDWGNGFDAANRPESYQHVGLNGMAERARLMGGTFDLQSEPGHGTTVRAVFPVPGPESDEPESGAFLPDADIAAGGWGGQ